MSRLPTIFAAAALLLPTAGHAQQEESYDYLALAKCECEGEMLRMSA